jgi:hypothetical protein
MAHEMLLEFLKLGLIDLQGSDERLEKLQLTATEVTFLIKKSPAKSISYSLVALDPTRARRSSFFLVEREIPHARVLTGGVGAVGN